MNTREYTILYIDIFSKVVIEIMLNINEIRIFNATKGKKNVLKTNWNELI